MKVAVFNAGVSRYLEEPPYHPPELYPELSAGGFHETAPDNRVYDAVRKTLALYGLDETNPLRRFVRPGDRVVIKPNFVSHEHGVQVGQHCLTTHGSVIRAVVDYAFLAAGRDSQIVIADAPVQGADFDRLLEQNGVSAIRDYYWRTFKYELGVLDLRQVRAVLDEQSAYIRRVEQLPGDPRGYSIIDLGTESRLRPLDNDSPRYAVGDYDEEVTNKRHRAPQHEYVISNTILDADAVISIPKLKTHGKVGLTLALKNIVGIVGSKDCLPHHRHGLDTRGGDEFPQNYPRRWLLATRGNQLLQGRVSTRVWRALRYVAEAVLGAGTPAREKETRPTKFFPSGSWYGNDTIWRTVDDLNRILYYWSRTTKSFAREPQRRVFTLVDGIISMQGNGPLKGSPRETGVILAAEDPLALDVAAATLIGFDWRKLNMLEGMARTANERAFSRFSGDVGEISLVSNVKEFSSVADFASAYPLIPPAGWRDFVDLEKSEAAKL